MKQTHKHKFCNKKTGKFKKKKQLKFYHILVWVGISMLLSGVIYNFSFQTNFFKADLVSLDLAPTFDGTVLPIKKVPNWVDLQNWESNYSELKQNEIIDMPLYNPEQLLVASTDLVWGNDASENIRNAQITYPVPYLGSYKLDGIEGSGSHPAVDIKTVKGTPVYAIANGVVIKAVNSSAGFGNHIVIGHKNAPSLGNPDNYENLYSSYSHLSEVLIQVGDIVKKGDLIGKVGATGTATTNHLHFQIDKESSAWHPYWPFTTTEASAAGLNFVQAVNAGLGQSNAMKYTINPMKYVQKYLDSNYQLVDNVEPENLFEEESNEEVAVNNQEEHFVADANQNPPTAEIATEIIIADDIVLEESSNEESLIEEPIESETPVIVPEPEIEEPIIMQTDLNFTKFEFEHNPFYKLNEPIFVYIRAKTDSGEIERMPNFKGAAKLKLSSNISSLQEAKLYDVSFMQKGFAETIITPKNAGKFRVLLTLGDQEFESDEIEIKSDDAEIDAIKLVYDGLFLLNTPKTVSVQLLDKNNNPAVFAGPKNDLTLKIESGDAKIEPEILKPSDFNNGKASFQVTVLKEKPPVISIDGFEFDFKSDLLPYGIFADIDSDSEYFGALKYLKSKKIIKGYPDNSFKSENTVSRVEALKFILESLDVKLEEDTILNFPDTSSFVWYSPYVATAQKLQIVKGYPDGKFKPENTVSKVEFFKMLLEAMNTDIDPAVKKNPYKDVDKFDWYAPYVQFAKEHDWVDKDVEYFEPGKGMSRGEVAKVLYEVVKELD